MRIFSVLGDHPYHSNYLYRLSRLSVNRQACTTLAILMHPISSAPTHCHLFERSALSPGWTNLELNPFRRLSKKEWLGVK